MRPPEVAPPFDDDDVQLVMAGVRAYMENVSRGADPAFAGRLLARSVPGWMLSSAYFGLVASGMLLGKQRATDRCEHAHTPAAVAVAFLNEDGTPVDAADPACPPGTVAASRFLAACAGSEWLAASQAWDYAVDRGATPALVALLQSAVSQLLAASL